MAEIKTVDASQLDSDLSGVADAIREKLGTSSPLAFPAGFVAGIENIETGTQLPELTNPGTAADLRQGKQLISQDGQVIPGALPEVAVAEPTISVSAAGVVTAVVDQPAGIVPKDRKTKTISQSTIPAQTITPTTEDQSLPAYRYLTGKQTIKGDVNLTPENIVKGVSIFGVDGSAETGGGAFVEPPSNDVDFYDYDGTRLYSYTLEEAQALTELPPLPSRDGLICQGWNWTLEEIKAWGKIADVGATYTTDDGATRIYIHITGLLNMPMTLFYGQTVDAGVVVDWGDGTEPQTANGTGAVSLSHAYTQRGHYIISIQALTGIVSLDNSKIFGDNYAAQSTIQRVAIGDNFGKLDTDAFADARNMKTISISNSVTGSISARYSGVEAVVIPRSSTSYSFGYSGFYPCYALRMISAPPTAGGNGATNNSCIRTCNVLPRIVVARPASEINNYEFAGSAALGSVVINPMDNFSRIGTSAFSGCYSLQEFEIPSTTKTIDTQAFNNCYSLKSLRFKPTTPPTVSNANAFAGIPADCVVEVPVGGLAAYQAATNYGGIAAQMVGV